MILFQVRKTLKTNEYKIYFTYKHLGKLFYNPPLFYAVCGTNNYSTIVFYYYIIACIHLLWLSLCVVPILYGFSKLCTSILVPQKFQHQPNLGPVSKYWPPKSGTHHIVGAKPYYRATYRVNKIILTWIISSIFFSIGLNHSRPASVVDQSYLGIVLCMCAECLSAICQISANNVSVNLIDAWSIMDLDFQTTVWIYCSDPTFLW